MSDLKIESLNPVVIGAIGGSGTRIVARILKEIGCKLGNDLNVSEDNLSFTYLFKYLEILSASDEHFGKLLKIFIKSMQGGGLSFSEAEMLTGLNHLHRGRFNEAWGRERVKAIKYGANNQGASEVWGWKEPNSHVILDRLIYFLPKMKYIHVIRNGLDMAYSQNQIQAKLWGKHFTGEEYQETPAYSLKYWCAVHRRVMSLGKKMGDGFLLLNFDDLCVKPLESILLLQKFLNLKVPESNLRSLSDMVNRPDSLGRFRKYRTDIFSKEDVDFVRELGFAIEKS